MRLAQGLATMCAIRLTTFYTKHHLHCTMCAIQLTALHKRRTRPPPPAFCPSLIPVLLLNFPAWKKGCPNRPGGVTTVEAILIKSSGEGAPLACGGKGKERT
eukprot:scaffold13578_cov18-Tisochrysis_lutea.AAC.1